LMSMLTMPCLQLSASSKSKTEDDSSQGYQKIHAKELKSWIDSGKQFQLIDARPKKFEKGDVILGAKFLAYDSDETKIAKILPSKDTVIVVYCASSECPASTYLAKQLVAMGYKHIYKYPEGIADWMDKEYPIQKAE
jgi:rhodanese-related sulfurtransferase